LPNILLVDDNLDDLQMIKRSLGHSFSDLLTQQASNAASLKVALFQGGFDLVITDYHLGFSTGLEVLRQVKEHYPDCPVIMFTLTGNEEIAVQAMKSGMEDYILKTPQHLAQLCTTVTRAINHQKERKTLETTQVALHDSEIENSRLFLDLQAANDELKLAYDATIEALSVAIDMRDHETEGHSQRVTNLTVRLAEHIGIDQTLLTQMRRGALLHDIGKLGVPDSVLLKPGKLDDDDWILMKQHPVLANEWLSRIPFLRPALEIPYAHHERWDGRGYPLGLQGTAIPLAARIFSVVDVYDALTSDRPYRKAWSKQKALENLVENAEKHFDPDVIRAFQAMIQYPVVA
jgi:response regulator RpfG family c-di-GMP phosphodiesterase